MSCWSDRALVVPCQSDDGPKVTVAWVTCCPVSTKRRDCHESRWVLAWSHSSVGRGVPGSNPGEIWQFFHFISLDIPYFFKGFLFIRILGSYRPK